MEKILKSIFFVIIFSLIGCTKYLEEKSDMKLVVPSNLDDLQSLLEFNTRMISIDASEGEMSATDFYISDQNFDALNQQGYKRIYTWQDDFLLESRSNRWSGIYTAIYTSNNILENLRGIKRTSYNEEQYDNIEGQAYFHRAKNFLQLSLIFSLAYDANSSSVDLGLPLRLNPDFNQTSKRSNVEETYKQIISDFQKSIELLPKVTTFKVRPSKAAAYGMLARTYLAMREYDKVRVYADSCLALYDNLIDYNTLDSLSTAPFVQFNDEVIFHSVIATPPPLSQQTAKIVPELLELYDENDLRNVIFFSANSDGTHSFKGSYVGGGNHSLFGGLATNEVYLMLSESLVRLGETKNGLEVLNKLLIRRWKRDEGESLFYPYTAESENEALRIVLEERRKELLMRGLRWMDVKRLNKEAFNIHLNRIVKGQNYDLPPNDLRYALPIPEDVIELSGMQQNPR